MRRFATVPMSYLQAACDGNMTAPNRAPRDGTDVARYGRSMAFRCGWTYTVIDQATLAFYPPDSRPPIIGKRRPFLQPDLNRRLHPESTIRIQTPAEHEKSRRRMGSWFV
jgi:hypothetical protein